MDCSSDPGTEPVLAGAGHRTLEVTRAGPDFQAGPFIVSYLCGSDNESGYRAFAHTLAAVVVAHGSRQAMECGAVVDAASGAIDASM